MFKTIVNPKYKEMEDLLKGLPSNFAGIGNVLADGRNTIKTVEHRGYTLNIKSFRIPILINQLAYASIRKSKAQRSYEYAMKLGALGFKTPDPVGYVEEQSAFRLQRSYYISIHQKFDGILQELQRGSVKEKEGLIRAFAQYTARLHESRVLHLDYSSGNILYNRHNDAYEFYLVDLNRMRFGKTIDMKTACHNFRRLWASEEMFELLISTYARSRNFDVEACVQLAVQIRRDFWKKFQKRHPDATPYKPR